MASPRERRFRYGYIIHLDTPDLESVLDSQVQQATAQWRDAKDPDLYKLVVDHDFSIKGRFDQDLFTIRRNPGDSPAASMFTPENTPGFVDALLYAVEFWNNGGSFYIGPAEHALKPDPQEMPNLSVYSISDQVSLAAITHYPVKLTKRLLRAFPGKLAYYPLQFRVSEPDENAVRAIVDEWASRMQQDLDVALEILRSEHPRGWAFTTPLTRLGTWFPNPEGLRYIGTKEQAEDEAVAYWGPCFLVDVGSGAYTSRWASR